MYDVKIEALYPGPCFHLNKSPPLLAHTSRLATRRLVSTFSSTAPISTDIKNISERTFVKTFKKSFFGRLLTVSLLLRNKEIYLYFYKVLYFPRKWFSIFDFHSIFAKPIHLSWIEEHLIIFIAFNLFRHLTMTCDKSQQRSNQRNWNFSV